MCSNKNPVEILAAQGIIGIFNLIGATVLDSTGYSEMLIAFSGNGGSEAEYFCVAGVEVCGDCSQGHPEIGFLRVWTYPGLSSERSDAQGKELAEIFASAKPVRFEELAPWWQDILLEFPEDHLPGADHDKGDKSQNADGKADFNLVANPVEAKELLSRLNIMQFLQSPEISETHTIIVFGNGQPSDFVLATIDEKKNISLQHIYGLARGRIKDARLKLLIENACPCEFNRLDPVFRHAIPGMPWSEILDEIKPAGSQSED